jgi:hypothetical protein
VAVVLFPALLIYWWWSSDRKLVPSLRALAGCAGAILVTFASYDAIWDVAKNTADISWSPLRSSIYSIYFPISEALKLGGVAPAQRVLSIVFVCAGAIVTFALLLRRPSKPQHLALVCVWIFNLYFLLAAPAVLEWYLTWSLACMLLLPGHFRFFAVLVSIYLPLVPFTIYLPLSVIVSISIVHYLLYAFCLFRFAPWRGDFRRGSQNDQSDDPALLLPSARPA